MVARPWFVDVLRRAGNECFWQVYLDNYMAGEVAAKASGGAASRALHSEAVESGPGGCAVRARQAKFQDLKLDALYYNVRPHFGEGIALHMFYLYLDLLQISTSALGT